jgi:hypothetical protein
MENDTLEKTAAVIGLILVSIVFIMGIVAPILLKYIA